MGGILFRRVYFVYDVGFLRFRSKKITLCVDFDFFEEISVLLETFRGKKVAAK